MKHSSTWLAGSAGFVALMLAAATATAQDSGSGQQDAKQCTNCGCAASKQSSATQTSAKIGRSEAEQTAQAQVPDGKIQSSKLERENGELVWAFDVKEPNSSEITEVTVDANNGELVNVSQESQEEAKMEQNESGNSSQQSSEEQFASQENRNQKQYGKSGKSRHQSQFSDTKRLLGQEVQDQEGETLGYIKDIVFNPKTGQLFTVISVGHQHDAVVPARVLKFGGRSENPTVTLNINRHSLQNAFLVRQGQALQALNSPGVAERILGQYQQPAEVGVIVIAPATEAGGVGAGNLGGSSSGTSGGNENQQRWQQQNNRQWQQQNGSRFQQ